MHMRGYSYWLVSLVTDVCSAMHASVVTVMTFHVVQVESWHTLAKPAAGIGQNHECIFLYTCKPSLPLRETGLALPIFGTSNMIRAHICVII